MNTRRSNGRVVQFVASTGLAADLQAVLVDLIELQIQAKQAHWTVIGPGFRALHLHLDEIVGTARDHTDSVAERMRALGASPDGRSDTVCRQSRLAAFPAGSAPVPQVTEVIADRVATAVATARKVRDRVDAEDPATTDLLHALIQELEKHLWMLRASLPVQGPES
ncbi:DNA starvation/stationary phase protection protein [Microlunatus sp. Gsoil 973]|nr:DNA starvation/stationary phase protection protein [Microlunatus sp. Gsoil 973]